MGGVRFEASTSEVGAVFKFISVHLTLTFLAWDKGRSVVIVKQTLARLQHMLTLPQFNDE